MKEIMILGGAFYLLKLGFVKFKEDIGTQKHINNLKWTLIAFGVVGFLIALTFPK